MRSLDTDIISMQTVPNFDIHELVQFYATTTRSVKIRHHTINLIIPMLAKTVQPSLFFRDLPPPKKKTSLEVSKVKRVLIRTKLEFDITGMLYIAEIIRLGKWR